MLRWSRVQLAKASKASAIAIQDFEWSLTNPVKSTLTKIRKALENAGVSFFPDGSIRLDSDQYVYGSIDTRKGSRTASRKRDKERRLARVVALAKVNPSEVSEKIVGNAKMLAGAEQIVVDLLFGAADGRVNAADPRVFDPTPIYQAICEGCDLHNDILPAVATFAKSLPKGALIRTWGSPPLLAAYRTRRPPRPVRGKQALKRNSPPATPPEPATPDTKETVAGEGQ